MIKPSGENSVAVFQFKEQPMQPVINVNLKFGRLYFNVFAVRTLQLDEGYFRVFQRGTRWLLCRSESRADLRLNFYQDAYYVVSKRLVGALVKHFQREKPSFIIEGSDRKRKYYTLKVFVPEVKAVRSPKEDPQLVAAARVIAKFEQTNFAGRVKTKEILRAEQLLNRTSKL
jgi:hypothetical protein